MDLSFEGKVKIEPINKEVWHQKKGEESFKRPTVIRALVDGDTQRYATGLTEEEAKDYGKRLGADLSDAFDPEQAHPFYDGPRGKIKLGQGTMFLDLQKDIEFVHYRILKASKFVLDSDKNPNEYPDATHTMYNAGEEIEKKATKIERKKQAVLASYEMSHQEKIDILMVMTDKSLKNQSTSYVDVAIDELVGEKPDEFLSIAKGSKEDLKTRALVVEGIMKNILTKEGNGIYYMGDRIADSERDAIDYFKSPQNQNLKASLIAKITGNVIAAKTNTTPKEEEKKTEDKAPVTTNTTEPKKQ